MELSPLPVMVLLISLTPVAHPQERPQAILSVSPQSWLTEGDSVTLNCEVTDSSTGWTFSWYTVVPYRNDSTQIKNNRGYIMYVEPLSDSNRGSGGSYTLSRVGFNHTGVYICRGVREEPPFHTDYSNPGSLWITGESPPVSLIINPSRTQHFTNDTLTLSCEDQSNSTGWTVRQYVHDRRVLNCSQESLIGSTCKIYSIRTVHNGHYWCHSETGGASNPVNISVHVGDVILESPVHPVTEGRPLTLRCLYHYTNPSKLRADFYKDGSILQTQTTGEMIIHKVSKSDEGFYHCRHPERGESPKSWVSISHNTRGSSTSVRTARVALGLSLAVWFNSLLILYILLGCRNEKKEKKQKVNQTSEQNQSRAEAEDSQSGNAPLQAGADVESIASSVIYADLDLKLLKKGRGIQGKASEGDDSIYSEMKHNMK